MKKSLKFIASSVSNDLKKKISIQTGSILTTPMVVQICPTQRCNVKCLMCNCWQEKNDYITIQDILSFIEELYQWIGSGFLVQIAGGEPLIYKDIYEVFRYCNERNIICKITTNGYSLNKNVCDKLIDSGLPFLSVSLDSHLPEVHDSFRGRKGTFDNAIKGIKYLQEHSNMVIGVSSIIMKENISEIDKLVDLLVDLKIDRILFQPIRDYYNPISEWTSYQYWINDFEILDKSIDYLIEKRKTEPKIFNTIHDFEIIRNYFKDPYSIINDRDCHIGLDQLSVDDKGEIFLCNEYRSIGNIKDGNIKKIWKDEKANSERKKMVSCKMPCTSNCKKELSFSQKIEKFVKLYQAGLFK